MKLSVSYVLIFSVKISPFSSASAIAKCVCIILKIPYLEMANFPDYVM